MFYYTSPVAYHSPVLWQINVSFLPQSSINIKFKEIAIMSQMIENLTRIDGEIVTHSQHPHLPDYDLLTVNILHAEPISGKKDLLSSYINQQINLTVRRELLGNKNLVGDKLYCRASRTVEGAMCEPFPEVIDFRIDSHQ
jgi:hypothetical protein